MKKLICSLLFVLIYSIIATAASGTAVIVQGNMFNEDGQNFIRIVYGADTIPVTNIQPVPGYPYFLSAGFPIDYHMGGGPGFCLTEEGSWNGEDDLYLELSFNRMPTTDFDFVQAIYRVNKEGKGFLVCDSAPYYELVTSFGGNVLAAEAIYSAHDTVTGALVRVYSKDGTLLSSKDYSVSFKRGPADMGVSIFNDFRLKQPDTLLFSYEYIIDDYGTRVYDSSYVILSESASIEREPQRRIMSPRLSRPIATIDVLGRGIANTNCAAYGLKLICYQNGVVVRNINLGRRR